MLVQRFSPRSTTDSAAAMARFLVPKRCASLEELARRLPEWEREVDESQSRFEMIADPVNIDSLKGLLPIALLAARFAGAEATGYNDMLSAVRRHVGDRHS